MSITPEEKARVMKEFGTKEGDTQSTSRHTKKTTMAAVAF